MATTTTPKAPATAPKSKGTALETPVTAREAKAITAAETKAATTAKQEGAVTAFKAASSAAASLGAELGTIQAQIDNQRVYMVRSLAQLNTIPALQAKAGTRAGRLSAATASKLLGVARTSLSNHFKALDVFLKIKETIAPDAKPQPKELDAVRAAWGMAAAQKAIERTVAKNAAALAPAPKSATNNNADSGEGNTPTSTPASVDAVAYLNKVAELVRSGRTWEVKELGEVRDALMDILDSVEIIEADLHAAG